MEYLIRRYQSEVGLTREQAVVAAEVTMQFLKEKFPAVLHAELDKVADGGEFGDATKEKAVDVKNKVEDLAKQAGEKAEEIAKEVKEKLSGFWHGK